MASSIPLRAALCVPLMSSEAARSEQIERTRMACFDVLGRFMCRPPFRTHIRPFTRWRAECSWHTLAESGSRQPLATRHPDVAGSKYAPDPGVETALMQACPQQPRALLTRELRHLVRGLGFEPTLNQSRGTQNRSEGTIINPHPESTMAHWC